MLAAVYRALGDRRPLLFVSRGPPASGDIEPVHKGLPARMNLTLMAPVPGQGSCKRSTSPTASCISCRVRPSEAPPCFVKLD